MLVDPPAVARDRPSTRPCRKVSKVMWIWSELRLLRAARPDLHAVSRAQSGALPDVGMCAVCAKNAEIPVF